MKAVIQRVKFCEVKVNDTIVGKISCGLLVLLGITHDDTVEDIQWLTQKIVNLRIFNDDVGVMNVSVKDANGEILVASQFTLHAATKKVIGRVTLRQQGQKLLYHFTKNS